MTRSEAARLGGLARAARLAPARRRAIAAMGFQALVDQRFAGDRRAAINWLIAAGLAAQDRDLSGSLRSLGSSARLLPFLGARLPRKTWKTRQSRLFEHS